MTYNQDWDRQLNPFRYKADGTLTDAAKEQNVAMQLNSAGGSGISTDGYGGGRASVHTTTLTKAEKALEEIRSDTGRVDLAALKATDESVLGLNGWDSAGGLNAMRARWADQGIDFSQRMSEASANLHNTNTAYRSADQDEKARMNSIDHGGNR
ncbi:hypothetical protein GTW98_13100 [Streptomyces sp. SID8375]|uniref:hypothetical protein n=1 Tax=unclassified Streptomyces TaxID=2593676 RepID=UPI000375752F|nr:MULTISPECIES: hypothetical protein [unclassified Streptomyces]MYX07731.1 hypothetical protein [Streptomyces sp. SID8375]